MNLFPAAKAVRLLRVGIGDSEYSVVMLVTSWATTEGAVGEFLRAMA